ncbi:MAG: CapA family protein [Opitutales bacterium]
MAEPTTTALVTLFLCGDVMTGRGIDQVLPSSVDPTLHEPYVRDARHYVEIAEEESGEIPAPVDYAYVWGDALDVLEDAKPDLRIINLETSVTTSEDYWKAKGIHYRMHPDNAALVSKAGIDCVVLANNHVLDWGYAGLEETLHVLEKNDIPAVGAGENDAAAAAPVVLEPDDAGRVLVFAYGTPGAGVPSTWAAQSDQPGVNVLPELSRSTARSVIETIRSRRRPDDLVVLSLHWGNNWGYQIPKEQVDFAHALIDSGAVDLIYGHSSHHVRPLEIYRNKLILYGCGDFINDYEGIGGHAGFRDDLTLMYFPVLDPRTGELRRLEMAPMEIRNFSLRRASEENARALHEILNRESADFGTEIVLRDGRLHLEQ